MRACPNCGAEYDESVAFCQVDGTELGGVDSVLDGAVEGGRGRLGMVYGSYRLIDVLGEGGMGTVYLAEHTRLGRRVALKLLHPEFANNPALVKRFFAEARAVNQIDHQHIVEITDFFEEEGEEKFYIMELLKGDDLAKVLRADGLMPLSRALLVMRQVAEGLGAAHHSGIVHRDLKPENIFLCHRDDDSVFVKLLDFGIAKLTRSDTGESVAKTATGALLGTPSYMSPEQLTGLEVDERSDIYALGVVMYQVVTGNRPLRGRSFGEIVLEQLTARPIAPSEVEGVPYAIPPALDDLILECLAKEPEARPQSMQQVERRLADIASMVTDAPASPRRKRRRRGRLSLAQMVATAVVLVTAFALGMGIVLMGRSPGTVLALIGREDAKAALPLKSPVSLPPPRLGGAQATGLQEAQEEAAQEAVTVEFTSNPVGAEVFVAGRKAPLGLTPFSAQLERSDVARDFEFRLAGYAAAIRTVSLTQDTGVWVTLAKAAPVSAAPEKFLSASSGRQGERRDSPSAATAKEPAPPARKAASHSSASSRKEARRGRRHKRRPQPKLDRRGTIDPFAGEWD